MRTRRLLAFASFALLLGCGGHPGVFDLAPAARVSLGAAGGDAEIDALAARFYGETLDPAAMRAELEAALERHPESATLHEMAAHLAELRADDRAAWLHWLSAASDTSTPFTAVYLQRALGRDLTGGEERASIALLREMSASHPRPAARVDAARRLIGLLEQHGRLEEAERLGAELGYLRAWRMVGAFDNDQGRGFQATEPPETEALDLDASFRGLRSEVRWREVTQYDRAGVAQLGAHLSPNRWAVAYLVTHVESPSAREAQLRLTTSSATKVWVNGRLVVAQDRLANAATDNFVLPITLRAGPNRIFVKSAQDGSGAWIFGARLTDREGRALPGLRADAGARAVDLEAPGDDSGNPSPLEEALAAVAPPLRRELLRHHDAVRNGYEGDALDQARALLELAPRHPVVLLTAATTHWTNEELGQAMDLLNEGAERFEGSAGFAYHRGAFYRERDRYDRAIEDLERARQLEPGARLAAMELSLTFGDRRWREHQCRVLDEVVARWPDSGWAVRSQAWCLGQRGYVEASRRAYERADALTPGHIWTLRRRAELARAEGDHERALTFARRARRTRPWDMGVLVFVADELRLAGRRAEARALLGAGLEIDPDWSSPHHRLGLMAFEDGDTAEALARWAAALERDPDNGPLADRVDFLRGDEDDPDRQLMPSAQDIEAALAQATEMEIDPGAHSVLVLDDEVTTVQQDGSSLRRITQVHLAVTTDGRDDLILNRVPGNARILEAYSVGPEGERQEASSIRGGTIRFRGLEVGSRVVLQYVFHAQPPPFLPNHFVSSWLFQGPQRQLGVARWVVQVPAGRELATHVQGPVEHRVERGETHDTHLFTAAGVPALQPEPAMPPMRDVLAMVTLSTLTDWQQYVDWERALLSEVFESNRQLRQLAQRLTEGAETPAAKLDAIYRYVAQEIRYQQDYEDTIAGVRPHSCPVVLERGYGDCKDKAVLMILLGREVGLDIRFAILRTTNAGAVRREVPNQQFNHAIVYVPQQDGIDEARFMDPTTDLLDAGNLRADDQGATSLVLDPDSGAWEFVDIPYQPAEMTYFSCDVDVSVTGAEQATADARCRGRGSMASAFRRIMRNEESASQLRQNLAQGIFQGSAVTGHSVAHAEDADAPLELNLELDASAALQPQGEERRLRVPSPFNLGRVTRLERRRLPLRLGVPDSARWEVTFEAPSGGRVVRTPEDFTIEHACFRVSRTTVTRGRRATVTIDYRRTCAEVSAEDYPELRRLAQRAQNQLQADVVISP